MFIKAGIHHRQFGCNHCNHGRTEKACQLFGRVHNISYTVSCIRRCVNFSEFVGYEYPTYYFSCFFNNTEANIR